MRVYIAAPWIERALACGVEVALEKQGFESTATWLQLPEDAPEGGNQLEAQQNIRDIMHADLLVLPNMQGRGHETRGKAVETGIAIKLGLPIILMGVKTNVFHHLAGVEIVPNLPTLFLATERFRKRFLQKG